MTSVYRRFTRRLAAPCVLAAAFLCMFHASVLAQGVSASLDEKLVPVVVTSTRTPQLAIDVLADHVVIDSDEIERSGTRSLIDLLQRQRGVEISRAGGPGTNANVYIRGADSKQSVVLIDGVRFASGTSGAPNWQGIPLSQVERVEIVYGPLSSLYGANAMGGVIQIFTKSGEGAPRLGASAEMGTYDSRAVSADLSGSAGEDRRWRYVFGLARERAQGPNATKPSLGASFNRDDDSYERESAHARFSYEVATGHELGLNILESRLESDFDSGSSAFDARNLLDQSVYAVSVKNRLLENWTSVLQLSRAFDRYKSITSALPSGTSTINSRSDLLSWQNDVAIGKDLLQLIIEHAEEHITSSTVGNRRRDTNSIAAAYLLRRNPHLATFSVRHDRGDLYGEKTTGNIGYAYRITSALRASASVGTSFRAPTFNELYFPGFGVPNIKPEDGKNAEVGLHYDDGKKLFNASYYRNRITNLIQQTFPVTNAEEAVLEGVTLGAGWKLAGFTWRASLDFQDPRDEKTDKLLVRRARRHGTLGVDYTDGGFKAGAETVFSDARFDNTANTRRLGGYGLLNLSTSIDVDRHWTLFARWNNVFDKDYELARGYRTEGSSFFVGVRYGMD